MLLHQFYRFPPSLQSSLWVLPWFQLFFYLPFFVQPFDGRQFAAVLVAHLLLLPLSFKSLWLNDRQVVVAFVIACLLAFGVSFFSVSCIGFYAVAVVVGAAHKHLPARLLMAAVNVAVFCVSAYLQQYSTQVVLIGLFFTVVNGINVSMAFNALFRNKVVQQSQDEVRSLATVAERERIAHDLHDLLGQSLTGISLKAELAEKVFSQNPKLAQQQLDEIQAIARSTLKEVRAAVSGYRQTSLTDELNNAKASLDTANIHLDAHIETVHVTQTIQQTLAWVIREACTNIVRHSGANQCRIELSQNNNNLKLQITDNGKGLVGQPYGTGLNSMMQRCDLINAQLRISSESGVRVSVIKELL